MTARCPTCHGSGKLLSAQLTATLAKIGRGTMSANELAIELGIAPITARDRLNRLCALGLVRCLKGRRPWDYRANRAKAAPPCAR